MAVVDNIMENTAQELLGSAQIQKSSTTRLLDALDNLSRILLLFMIPRKRNLLILVISAYNFLILLSLSTEKYSQVMYFLSLETEMVMLLLR